MIYNLRLSNDIALNYHFLGGIEQRFIGALHALDLKQGYLDGKPDIYFLETYPITKLKEVIKFAKRKYNLDMPCEDWTSYSDKVGVFWEHKSSGRWLIPVNLRDSFFDQSREYKEKLWPTFFICFPTFMLAQLNGGLLLHGGLVSFQGKALTILASGGTGKTTTCNRLPSSWEVHADDQFLAFQTKNGSIVAHGFPSWSTWYEGMKIPRYQPERAVSLKAILYLEQALEDQIIPLPLSLSAVRLFSSAIQMNKSLLRFCSGKQKAQYARLITFRVETFVSTLKCYRLMLSLTGAFWGELECLLNTSA